MASTDLLFSQEILSIPKQDLNRVLHLTCAIFYLYLGYFDWTKLNWPERPLSDKLNKFTNWNYSILTVYWVLSSVNDFTHSHWMHVILTELALAIILPCSLVVCIGFWAMNSVEPTLTRSNDFYEHVGRCPMWYSHGVHTLVLLLPLLEMWLGLTEVTKSVPEVKTAQEVALESLGSWLHWRKLLMYSLWAGGYALVVFYYGLAKSSWPYPFMSKLTIQGKIILGVCVTVTGFTLMLGVSHAYCYVHTSLTNDVTTQGHVTDGLHHYLTTSSNN